MLDYIISSIIGLAPINVLIIDTGVNPKPYAKYIRQADDQIGAHGHAVTGIVLSDQLNDWVCNRVRITVCATKPYDEGSYTSCLWKAAFGNYDIVNMSLYGASDGTSGWDKTEKILLTMLQKHSIIVVAAGNEHEHLTRGLPAGHIVINDENFFVATNSGAPSSNYGWYPHVVDVDGVDIRVLMLDDNVGYMTGTSMSAARYTHRLVQWGCNGLRW